MVYMVIKWPRRSLAIRTSLFSSPEQATAAAVRSTTQAATAAAATTGRVRSTRSARTSRVSCTSAQSTCTGTGTTNIGTMGSVSVLYALKREDWKYQQETLTLILRWEFFCGSNRTVASCSKVLEDTKISRRCYSEDSVRSRWSHDEVTMRSRWRWGVDRGLYKGNK